LGFLPPWTSKVSVHGIATCRTSNLLLTETLSSHGDKKSALQNAMLTGQ
jgi:hypothetical protein